MSFTSYVTSGKSLHLSEPYSRSKSSKRTYIINIYEASIYDSILTYIVSFASPYPQAHRSAVTCPRYVRGPGTCSGTASQAPTASGGTSSGPKSPHLWPWELPQCSHRAGFTGELGPDDRGQEGEPGRTAPEKVGLERLRRHH